MEPNEIYNDFIHVKTVGVFGNQEEKIHYTGLPDMAIVKAFWDDNDIQEITVVSTNIGFIKTFSKSYKPLKDEACND